MGLSLECSHPLISISNQQPYTTTLPVLPGSIAMCPNWQDVEKHLLVCLPACLAVCLASSLPLKKGPKQLVLGIPFGVWCCLERDERASSRWQVQVTEQVWVWLWCWWSYRGRLCCCCCSGRTPPVGPAPRSAWSCGPGNARPHWTEPSAAPVSSSSVSVPAGLSVTHTHTDTHTHRFLNYNVMNKSHVHKYSIIKHSQYSRTHTHTHPHTH